MFNKILVPIDIAQSDSGEAGLKAAASLATATNARLVLVNVIGDIPNLVANQLPNNHLDMMKQSAEKALHEVAAKNGLEAGSYEVQTDQGQIYHKIIEAADKSSAELIVIASHQPDLADYLLGSTAAKVVRHAHCSVMVVRD